MDWSIKTYDPADAASIAQMWNESDEGWPGGFTGGVPFTEERVRQWLTEERFIDVFLVIADNRVVAYCSLYEYAAEPSAAYVALLNCHPSYWKHGFGRELLKKAVARSTELGYKRLDLHTWPGNLRAVPLYKKTGFFWQPETHVHMLNFLPLILPLASDYFAGADWYKIYQRALEQVEDDIVWQGMKVYPYTFNNDGRLLKVVIDRESRGVTAFENDDFSVACLIDGQELVAGVASPVRWEISNKKATPLSVSLLATGDEGLSVYKKATFEVADHALIEGEIAIDRDIVARHKDEPAHKITTTLVVDGKLLVLETGVRPQQAIEISADPAYVSLTPGLAQAVHWRLKSNLKQPVQASLAFLPPPGVTIDKAVHAVDLPAEGYAGVSCTLTSAHAGAPAIRAALSAETDKGLVTVKPVGLPIAAPGPGMPAGYLRQDEAVLENEWLRLVVAYKGAQMTLYRKTGNLWLLFQRSSLGPPFYPNEFRGMRFSARIDQIDGIVSATLSAQSGQHNGLTFERVFTIDSSPVLTIEHKLHNTSSQEYSFQLRVGNFSQFGEASLTLPTAQGIVDDLAPSFPDWYDDEGRKPESLSESWLAFNGRGFVLGIIWSGAKENSMDPWERPELTLTMPVLPAHGHADAPPIYVYAGAGDWRDVRRAWRRWVSPTADATMPPTRRVLCAATIPSPLVVLDGTAETTLHLDNQRSRALAGSVEIEAPAGWTVTPAQAEFADLKRGQPHDVSLTVSRAADAAPAAAEGSIIVRHELAEECLPLPLLALGRRSAVKLQEYDEHGRRLISIDNGRMRLVVAPDHNGSIIALEQDGANHLLSSYPTPRAFSWINPWHGGVSAVILAPSDDDAGPGNPGRMFLETWSYELLPAAQGAVPWCGVRVSSMLKRDCFRGLRLDLDYLTIGHSNVLAVVTRLVNTTAAPFSAVLMTQAYVQAGGDHKMGVLHYGDGRQLRRLPAFEWGGSSDAWAGVANAESSDCMAMVAAGGGSRITALDYGMDGAHFFNVAQPILEPRGSFEMLSYLILAPDVAQARLYCALEHWQWSTP